MANNFPFDPKNAPIGNPATPQSGTDGAMQNAPAAATPSGVASGSPSAGGLRRLTPGIVLSSGRYKIERLAAAGGMGAVYRAIDMRFDRPCAVKEMLDDFQAEAERSQAVEWFKREATLLLDLNHACIPRVRDFFVEEGRHYLVMDFIDGRTLGEVLEKEGNVQGLNSARGVTEARARSWAQQVCSVLAYLHRQAPPIIFRDLKPSNIMVTTSDEVKLIDFGIARTFQSQRQSTIIMTIGYAPPEQLHGMPEPRSDIYALGATLHRVLTHHDAANNKPSIFSFPPIRTLRPDISPAFEQVLSKALSPALEQRWLNAGEMERAIISLPPISTQAPTIFTPQPSGQNLANPQTPSHVSAPATGGTTGPGGPYIMAALGHLGAGRIEPAYAAVQQAFALEPNNAMVHKLFGQVFARRRPPSADLAIQAYNRSVQLNSNDSETHKLVGDVYLFILQRPGDAIAAYTQSLRLNPNDFEAHQRLAQCYQRTNQLDAALREFQEALRLAPTKTAFLYAETGRLAFQMKQFPNAERNFVQALTINPADHDSRFLLSQVYEAENKLDDALRECRYVVGSQPANQGAQMMLQRLQARVGR